jgi:hypothetical protein
MLLVRCLILLVIAVFGVMFAGCMAISDQPLSDPAKSAVDEKLFGFWLVKDDGRGRDVWVFGRAPAVGKNDPPGLMRMASVRISPKDEVDEPGSMLIFPSQIGGNSYFNVIDEKMFNASTKNWHTAKLAYLLAKYRVTGDRLEIWSGNYSRVGAAIDKGLVKGEVTREKDGKVKTAKLTDTTENLAKFLQNGGDEALFGGDPSFVLTRVRLER